MTEKNGQKKKERKNQWQKKLKIYNIQVYLFGEGGVFKIDVRFGIVGLNLPKKNNTAFLSGERIECRQQNLTLFAFILRPLIFKEKRSSNINFH